MQLLFMPSERLVCCTVIFWCRSSMSTAEEDWGFRAALSALSNERGKPAHHGTPWCLCHNAVDVHVPCVEEPITWNTLVSKHRRATQGNWRDKHRWEVAPGGLEELG